MELTINISPEASAVLQQRAAATGQDIKSFVETIINKQALRPTLDEILAPVRKEFAESGMSEHELDELIKKERRAMREENHGKRS